MIANCKGRNVRVMKEDGSTVRIIGCSAEAVSAYVNGDEVNVQLANGHSEIYRTNGSLVRRF